jgi:hypothetical protein
MAVANHLLDAFRQVTDVTADQLVGELFAAGSSAEVYEALQRPRTAVLAQTSAAGNFLVAARPEPTWAEPKRIQQGRVIFQTHTNLIMRILGAFSLPFCYAASPGNKALYLSDKMRQSPGKRLQDTARFVLMVGQPGAPAEFTYAINRTRLIHAIARWHLRQRGWKPAWGAPINQEDLAGTNLAFSYLVLLGLQQSGVLLSTSEKENFLHLWRHIGYHLHIAEALLPANFAEARQLTAQIRTRNLMKSEEGVALTRDLIQFYQQSTGTTDAGLIKAQLVWYLGKEVASYLGIEPPTRTYRLVDFVQQWSVLGYLFDRPLKTPDPFTKMKGALAPDLIR